MKKIKLTLHIEFWFCNGLVVLFFQFVFIFTNCLYKTLWRITFQLEFDLELDAVHLGSLWTNNMSNLSGGSIPTRTSFHDMISTIENTTRTVTCIRTIHFTPAMWPQSTNWFENNNVAWVLKFLRPVPVNGSVVLHCFEPTQAFAVPWCQFTTICGKCYFCAQVRITHGQGQRYGLIVKQALGYCSQTCIVQVYRPHGNQLNKCFFVNVLYFVVLQPKFSQVVKSSESQFAQGCKLISPQEKLSQVYKAFKHGVHKCYDLVACQI